MIWQGFLIGLLGSLHCIGMCGPIAFVLPIGQRTKSGKILGISIYNLGRITTYSLLGFLIGFFGEGLRFMGVSQIISIVLGVLLIVYVVFAKKLVKLNTTNKYLYELNGFVKAKVGVFLKKKAR